MLKFNNETPIKVAYYSTGVNSDGIAYSVLAFCEKQNRGAEDKGSKDALVKIWNPVINGEIKDGAYINVLSVDVNGFKFKHAERLKDGTWADRPAIEFAGGEVKVLD